MSKFFNINVDYESSEQLKWYLRNVQFIAPWDQFVLEYTEDGIEQMSSYVKTRLVKNLETLQKVYAEERLTADKGQSIIRRFFGLRRRSNE